MLFKTQFFATPSTSAIDARPGVPFKRTTPAVAMFWGISTINGIILATNAPQIVMHATMP